MRIDPNTRAEQAQDLAKANPSNARATVAANNERTSGADATEISPDQVRVQSLAAQVNALPEIRQNKVEALGRAIRQGSYQVSAEQTAAAMLSELVQPAAA